MKTASAYVWAVLAAAGLLGALSVHAADPALVKIDGSSSVYPLSEAIAEEFQADQKGKIRVTVGISGTGGGFKKFCRGETDVSNASRPILKEEMVNCKTVGVKYFELPVAFDSLTVAVNPKNTWVKDGITVSDLKKIWEPAAQGKILTWNQVRPEWPNEAIKLYGAGADSGTFDYFTEAIVGKSKSIRGDYTASTDHNLTVSGVASERGSIGFLPFAYFESNKKKLRALAIDAEGKGPQKGPVEPNAQNVVKGTYFPLSRPLFIYVNAASLDKSEVKTYVDFALSHAAALAPQVRYVALPERAYKAAADHLKKKRLGTAFGGTPEVGATIDEILNHEASL